MKKFYSHIIEMESVFVELDKMDLEDYERVHLAKLIDSNLHNSILEVILSELSEEDKYIFLKYLSKDKHDKLWEHLNSKVDNIEEKIKKVAEDLKVELHKDIEESKKIKG